MTSIYTPLIVEKNNWETVKHNLAAFPVRCSTFTNLESVIKVKSISIKYVLNGKERYKIDKKEHNMTDGHYIVANQYSDCEVAIKTKEGSHGICIDIAENLFVEALQCLFAPNDFEADFHESKQFFCTSELFSQGKCANFSLKKLLQSVENQQEVLFIQDFLKDIALELVKDQTRLIRAYNRVETMKISTKKELFHRLELAKNIITDTASHQVTMKQIAQQVCLSEFRFHHLFKSAFGITAHQFQHQILLQRALDLHQKQAYSWAAIADILGYPDYQTFSKVFKKAYGIAPRFYDAVSPRLLYQNRTGSVSKSNMLQ